MWNWSFGDGTWFNTTSATLKNPTHTYSTAGIYNAKLTVCNAAGCSTTPGGETITVLSPPIVNFKTNAVAGYAPFSVWFIDFTTESPNMWNWSFGDGSWFNTTTAALRNPTHVYTTAGTYSATLIACNTSGCNTTAPSQTITVRLLTLPSVSISANVSSGYAPLTVRFVDISSGSPTAWNWSFGDGNWFNTTTFTLKNPIYTYSSPGSFTAKLIACNAVGCNTTGLTKTISVSLLTPPNVAFYSTTSSGYAPLSVGFVDTSTGSPTAWNWSFGDGSWFNTSSASLKNPTHTYSSPGSYTAKLIACNAAGCNTTGPTKTISVSLLSPPVPAFLTNRTSGAVPLAVQFYDRSSGITNEWRWDFGDGSWFNTTSVSLRNPIYIYTSNGTYTTKLIACNAAGCATSASLRTITVA